MAYIGLLLIGVIYLFFIDCVTYCKNKENKSITPPKPPLPPPPREKKLR